MRRIIGIILLIPLLIGGFIYYKANFGNKRLENGENTVRYTFEELDEMGQTGVFVHNSDGTFSPAIRSMPNYEGETDDTLPSRFLWYVESNKDIDELIPTVTSDGELVIVYNMDGDLPSSYYLEKYALRGYTIGAHVYLESTKSMFLGSKDTLSGSQAADTLAQMQKNTDDVYEIAEISGSSVLPIKNVDPNMNLLLGLEKDKLYNIRYYQGTKERETTFKADTKVFQSERYIPISTPYIKTTKGYFVVNLPQNLPNGYYYLSDIGFFAYKR